MTANVMYSIQIKCITLMLYNISSLNSLKCENRGNIMVLNTSSKGKFYIISLGIPLERQHGITMVNIPKMMILP